MRVCLRRITYSYMNLHHFCAIYHVNPPTLGLYPWYLRMWGGTPCATCVLQKCFVCLFGVFCVACFTWVLFYLSHVVFDHFRSVSFVNQINQCECFWKKVKTDIREKYECIWEYGYLCTRTYLTDSNPNLPGSVAPWWRSCPNIHTFRHDMQGTHF